MTVVWEQATDRRREEIVRQAIQPYWPELIFEPTPKFFPTDYHLSLPEGDPFAGYIGDMEVKWFNHSSSRGGMFNYNKLMRIMQMTMFRDHHMAYHRLALRYSDGVLLIPARLLASIQPEWFTRRDTKERDLVIHVPIESLKPKYWMAVKTTDE